MKHTCSGLVLSLGLLIAAQAQATAKHPSSKASANAEPYEVSIAIVNEKSLPPSKLADALYARAGITFDIGPLKKAASLDPNDPVYWYRLATWTVIRPGMCLSEEQLEDWAIRPAWGHHKAYPAGWTKPEKAFRERRCLLERALAADPRYLPALYVYAITKPTHRQRLQALEDVAKIDQDNAKPYYIMAILQSEEVTRNKKWMTKSQAYVVSHQEWQSVLDLIRKGNERAVFQATPGRLPSIADIRVSTNGQPWPTSSVENLLRSMLNDLGTGGLAESPLSFRFGAYARQMARQTSWQAQQCAGNGKRAEAMNMVQVIQSFGDKVARSEPHRLMPFAVGASLKSFAFAAESKTFSAPAEKEQREHADQQSKTWHKTALDVLNKSMESLQTKDKAVRTSKSEYLQYPDFAAEEAQVNSLIKIMGLED